MRASYDLADVSTGPASEPTARDGSGLRDFGSAEILEGRLDPGTGGPPSRLRCGRERVFPESTIGHWPLASGYWPLA